jgi:hypothetical protein
LPALDDRIVALSQCRKQETLVLKLRKLFGRAPILLAFAAGAAVAHAAGSDQPYLTQAQAAMDRMMHGMMVRPTGDVDADFVAMMVPHHQGAIDMAVAELRFGRNEQLKRIAQEIIVDQQQEIAAMNLAIGAPLPPSAPVPTQPGWSAPTHHHHEE